MTICRNKDDTAIVLINGAEDHDEYIIDNTHMMSPTDSTHHGSTSYLDLEKLEEEIEDDISISSCSDDEDDDDDERFIAFQLNDIDFPSSSFSCQRRRQEQGKKHRRVPKSRLQELQNKVDEDTQQLIKMKSEELRRQRQRKQKQQKTKMTKRNSIKQSKQSGRDLTSDKQSTVTRHRGRRCSPMRNNHHIDATRDACYRMVR